MSRLEELIRSHLSEGIFDPGIFKAVFLAGGPGSGKSFAVKEVFGVHDIMRGVDAFGLKIVNSDPAFERELRKRGVDPKNLQHMAEPIFQYYTNRPDSPRQIAKQQTQARQKIYETGRLGMIIDGTGDDYDKIKKKKEMLEDMGYDTAMLFVDTTLPIALMRNNQRPRRLKEHIVRENWTLCQENTAHQR